MSRTNEELNLIFDEPVQKKKAPKHIADFAPEERKNFAKELGGEVIALDVDASKE